MLGKRFFTFFVNFEGEKRSELRSSHLKISRPVLRCFCESIFNETCEPNTKFMASWRSAGTRFLLPVAVELNDIFVFSLNLDYRRLSGSVHSAGKTWPPVGRCEGGWGFHGVGKEVKLATSSQHYGHDWWREMFPSLKPFSYVIRRSRFHHDYYRRFFFFARKISANGKKKSRNNNETCAETQKDGERK